MTRNGWYILDDDHNPVPVSGLLEWAEWVSVHDSRRHVACDEIGGVQVSTIFLGWDHKGRFSAGPPILFETMILEGEHHGWQRRCATFGEAQALHGRAVRLVRTGSEEPLQ